MYEETRDLTESQFFDQYLGPLIMGERPPSTLDASTDIMKRLHAMLESPDFIEVVYSENFDRVRSWWAGDHEWNEIDWTLERCTNDYNLTYVVALLACLDHNPFKERFNTFLYMRTEEGQTYVNYRDRQTRIIKEHVFGSPISAKMYVMCQELPMVRSLNDFQRLFRASMTSSTFYQAISHLAMQAIYGVLNTAAINLEHQVTVSVLLPKSSKSYHLLRHVNSACHQKVKDWLYLHGDKVMNILRLQRSMWNRVYCETRPSEASGMYHLVVHVAAATEDTTHNMTAEMNLYQVLSENGEGLCNRLSKRQADAMLCKMSNQQCFDALTPVPVLRYAVSNDMELPEVRGENKQIFRYPVVLPVSLKTRRLTSGQVATLEFMESMEKSSFVEQLGKTHQGMLISPYPDACIQQTPNIPATARRYTGGVIANETGTGKTLTLLTRCVADGVNMIVVPDVLVMHWSSEVRKHFDLRVWEDPQYLSGKRQQISKPYAPNTFDVIVLHRTRDLARHEWDLKSLPKILVVSHSVVRSKNFLERFNRIFTRMVVDEAHAINKKSTTHTIMNKVKRRVTWLVTATPYHDTTSTNALLRLDKIFPLLAQYQHESRATAFKLHRCTIRTKFDRTHVKVNEVKQYCEMTEEESGLFLEIAKMIDNTFNEHPHDCLMTNPTRFFRILERLGAGGYVNKPLILRVLQQTLKRDEGRGRARVNGTLEVKGLASKKAYNKSTEECTVCMCNYSDPVQTKCGHVFCKDCLKSMLDLNMTACAYCRTAMSYTVWEPNWPDKVSKPAEKRAIEIPDDNKDEPKVDYRQVLAGQQGAGEGNVYLRGKSAAFREQLGKWKESRADGGQLVVFTKERLPASEFVNIIKDHGLSVLYAGVLDARKVESVANIEKFRQGQADVLLISNRYSDGFDLFMAEEVWLLNSDVSSAKMEQSQGRVMRVAQKHSEVTVRVFVYRRMFDEFLWDFRSELQGRFTRAALSKFAYYALKDVPGTMSYELRRVFLKLNHAFQERDLRFTQHGTIRFNRHTIIRTYRRAVYSRGGSYTFDWINAASHAQLLQYHVLG